MANNYNNLISIKFARAEQPKFLENKNKNFVEFGANNDYPQYLQGLFNESPKHGAIVKSKVKYIYGQGFKDLPIKANVKGESFNQVAKRCILDDELYGGYYLQIIYNLLGNVKDVYHIEFHKVRVSADQSEFYVKNDWNSYKEKPRVYPAFNVQDKAPSQILFVKQYNPQSEIYPLPNYFQGLNYIESDVQVSRHILGNAKEGFVAGTLINMNGGEPQEEQKSAVESGIKKKFTGSEGDRVVIMFNKSKDNAAEILPLSSTMLTKEDFTNINNLIQQEIFAAHQITSPALMGIKTEGQLGGRSEIRDAYEIFNNVYVNERQNAIDETFNTLFKLIGLKEEFNLMPVEPLKFEFNEAIMSQNLTKDEIRAIMGKEPLDSSITTHAQIISDNINRLSPLVANKVLDSMTPDEIRSLAGLIVISAPIAPGVVQDQPTAMVNDSLKNLSGRQHQNVMRIVRQFNTGKLSKEQAALMLKNGFGFSDNDVDTFLHIQQFSAQENIEFDIIEAFTSIGENLEDYKVLSEQPAQTVQYFAATKELSTLETKVLELIKKDSKITNDVIAEVLKQDIKTVDAITESLLKEKILKVGTDKVGTDKIPTREITNVETIPAKTIDIFIRYKYAWRDIVPVEQRDKKTSRAFCQKFMELSETRVWSRQNIEQISEVLGYSVWDRVGGWWTIPGSNPVEHSPQCRHEWKAIIVTKKSN